MDRGSWQATAHGVATELEATNQDENNCSWPSLRTRSLVPGMPDLISSESTHVISVSPLPQKSVIVIQGSLLTATTKKVPAS